MEGKGVDPWLGWAGGWAGGLGRAGQGLGPHFVGLHVLSVLRWGLGPKRVRFRPGGVCERPVTLRPLRGRRQRRHQGQQAPVVTPTYTLYTIYLLKTHLV